MLHGSTAWHNQMGHVARLTVHYIDERFKRGIPNGIRTRVVAVKGRCPWPPDDGDGSQRYPGESGSPRKRFD